MTDARDLIANIEFDLDFSEEALRKAINDHPEVTKALKIHLSWLEGIGVLVREGYLDIRVIAELMSASVKSSWDKRGPAMIEYRKVFNMPHEYVEFEYIYNALMKYYEEHPELVAP